MKKKVFILIVLLVSFFIQTYLNFIISAEFISTILTVLSIFFGFYVTSFAVFATSKYLGRLYKIENAKDNRKTLLDDLLGEFTYATKFLLSSIVFFILCYVFIENSIQQPVVSLLNLIWGILTINIFFAFSAISIFIKVTRQSAKSYHP